MAYGPSQAENLQRALHHVDKILKGLHQVRASHPFQQPTKFEFIMNLKTGQPNWRDDIAESMLAISNR